MKPPNHGMRVKVTDSFLWWTGHLLYTPTTKAVPWRYGLSSRSNCGVEPLLRGDRYRITLLP